MPSSRSVIPATDDGQYSQVCEKVPTMGKRNQISRRAAEARANLYSSLGSLGFTSDESDALRRVSMALHSWAEHECNGTIQRDEATGIPYFHSEYDGRRLGRAQDRERGALRKLETILKAHPGVSAYIQGDPRGCCLLYTSPSPRDRQKSRMPSSA